MVETTDRLRALVVKRGELHVSLHSHDIDALLQAIDVMVDGHRSHPQAKLALFR